MNETSTTDFATGDVVQLCQDGDRMTVRGVNGDFVDCDWFDAANQLQGRTFPREDLRLVSR
jgi:uncharacterized protein YodC (DUF2158 family)